MPVTKELVTKLKVSRQEELRVAELLDNEMQDRLQKQLRESIISYAEKPKPSFTLKSNPNEKLFITEKKFVEMMMMLNG